MAFYAKIHTILWDEGSLTGLRQVLVDGWNNASQARLYSENSETNAGRIIAFRKPEGPASNDENERREYLERRIREIRDQEDTYKIIVLAGERMVSLCSDYLVSLPLEEVKDLSAHNVSFVYMCAHGIHFKDSDLKEDKEKKALLSKIVFLFWAPRTIDTIHFIAWNLVKKSAIKRFVVLHDGTSYANTARQYFESHCRMLGVEAERITCINVQEEEEKEIIRKAFPIEKEKTEEDGEGKANGSDVGIYIVGYIPDFYEKVESILNSKRDQYDPQNVWICDCVLFDQSFSKEHSVFQNFNHFDVGGPQNRQYKETASACTISIDLYSFLNKMLLDNSQGRLADILSKKQAFVSENSDIVFVAPHSGTPMYPLSVCRKNSGMVRLIERRRRQEMKNNKLKVELIVQQYITDFRKSRTNSKGFRSQKTLNDIIGSIRGILKETKKILGLNDLQLIFSDDTLNRSLNEAPQDQHVFHVTAILDSCISFSNSLQINIVKDDYEDNGTGRFYVRSEDGIFQPLLFSMEGRHAGERKEKGEKSLYVSTSLETLTYAESYLYDSVNKVPDSKAVFHEIDEIYAYCKALNDKIKKIHQSGSYIVKSQVDYRIKYCYIVPVMVDDPHKSFGAFVLTATERLDSHSLRFLWDIENRLFDPLLHVLHRYQLNFALTRSAIGSIMSRNGSHNIGSHVLSAMSHNVGTMPDDQILFQYIQHRMDYVAQVTTEFPSWAQPTMFVGDIMKGFFSQHHLLEYIAQSENLHAYHFRDQNMDAEARRNQDSCIKLFIRKITPSPETGTIDADHVLGVERYYNGKIHSFIDYDEQNSIQLDKDVALAIPGGVVGKHAFYTILENLIRNAAKHGWSAMPRRKDYLENLEIYIDFINDPDKDDVVFTIWDNMSDIFLPWKKKDANKPGCWNHELVIPVVLLSLKEHMTAWNALTDEAKCSTTRTEDAKHELEEVKKYLPALIRREIDYLTACLKAGKEVFFRKRPPDESELTEEERKAGKLIFVNILTGDERRMTEAELIDANMSELDNLLDACESCIKKISGETCLCNVTRDEKITPKANFRDEDLDATLDTLIREDYIHPLSTAGVRYFTSLNEKENDEGKNARVLKVVQPLHWKLQLDLAMPLINSKTGALRRENWGLAEIKISAGYLQRRSIDEIGGLDDNCLYYGNAIISPTSRPGVCHSTLNNNKCIACNDKDAKTYCQEKAPEDCPRKNCIYHLGYRFTVPKPREILIILSNRNGDQHEETDFTDEEKRHYSVLHQNGIYIKTIKDAQTNAAGDPRFFSYEFVVFPSLEVAEELVPDTVIPNSVTPAPTGAERLKYANYPFRLLINTSSACSDLQKRMFPCITLPSEKEKLNDPAAIQQIVLAGWRKHWIDRRQEKEDTKKGLQLTIKLKDDNESGDGLLTDADLLTFVFQHCFYSAVQTFLVRNKEEIDEDLVIFLTALASMKKHDFLSQKAFSELGAAGSEHAIWFAAQLLEWINALSFAGSPIPKGAFDKAQWVACTSEENYNTIREEDITAIIENYKTILENGSWNIGMSEDNTSGGGLFDDYLETKPTDPDLERFLTHLNGFFDQANVFLRKNAEKPVTLPQGYETSSSFGRNDEKTWFIHPNGSCIKEKIDDCLALNYIRHFEPDKNPEVVKETTYAEPLSGIQSYLYELADLIRKDTGNQSSATDTKTIIQRELTITKLVENALARILIIDERVCDFFQSHSTIQPTLSSMNIWVCDTTTSDKPPHVAEDGCYLHLPPVNRTESVLLKPEFLKATPENPNQFDILIIHQGLIDKWLPVEQKNEQGIRRFIESLKKVIPYVVLTTGRGRPANTPDEIRVIPYSVVASSILKKYPEKMILVNTIMNVLPVGKKQ